MRRIFFIKFKGMEDDVSFKSLEQILNMPKTTIETKIHIIIAKMSTCFNKKGLPFPTYFISTKIIWIRQNEPSIKKARDEKNWNYWYQVICLTSDKSLITEGHLPWIWSSEIYLYLPQVCSLQLYFYFSCSVNKLSFWECNQKFWRSFIYNWFHIYNIGKKFFYSEKGYEIFGVEEKNSNINVFLLLSNFFRY